MKSTISLFLILLFSVNLNYASQGMGPGPGAYYVAGGGSPASYSYGPFTIDHTKCGTADSSSFPVYFTITDAALKSEANGGHVHFTTGNDIWACSDATCSGTRYPVEKTVYDPVNGILHAYAAMPVTYASNTQFHLSYGGTVGAARPDTSTDSTYGSAKVWDPHFQYVLHLNGYPSTLNVNDSTGNSTNGSNNGATSAVGQVDGGANFNGSSFVAVANIAVGSEPFMVCQSIYPTNVTSTSISWAAMFYDMYEPSGWFISISSGSLQFTATDNWAYSSPPTASVSANTWYRVCAMETSTSSRSLYVNGVLIGTNTTYRHPDYVSNGYIGRRPDGLYFNGVIDETEVSTGINRGIDWIKTDYNNLNNPTVGGSNPFFTSFGSEASH